MSFAARLSLSLSLSLSLGAPKATPDEPDNTDSDAEVAEPVLDTEVCGLAKNERPLCQGGEGALAGFEGGVEEYGDPYFCCRRCWCCCRVTAKVMLAVSVSAPCSGSVSSSSPARYSWPLYRSPPMSVVAAEEQEEEEEREEREPPRWRRPPSKKPGVSIMSSVEGVKGVCACVC